MKSTDEGINVVKAMEAIAEMQTAEEIINYVDGEERSTVLNLAEKRIKAIEKAKETPPPAPPEVTATVAAQDCWRYHETETPRIFRKGDTIPAGWTIDAAVRRLWTCDPNGVFSKVEVKP